MKRWHLILISAAVGSLPWVVPRIAHTKWWGLGVPAFPSKRVAVVTPVPATNGIFETFANGFERIGSSNTFFIFITEHGNDLAIGFVTNLTRTGRVWVVPRDRLRINFKGLQDGLEAQ